MAGSEIIRGDTFIQCVGKKLKDQWITADRARNECNRGGGYARQVLENAAALGIIEKREREELVTEYRVDPDGDRVVCVLQPDRPYEETACYEVDKLLQSDPENDLRAIGDALLELVQETFARDTQKATALLVLAHRAMATSALVSPCDVPGCEDELCDFTRPEARDHRGPEVESDFEEMRRKNDGISNVTF